VATLPPAEIIYDGGFVIDRTIENSGGANPIVAQGGDGGRPLPAAMCDFGREPDTALPIAGMGAMLVLVQASSLR